MLNVGLAGFGLSGRYFHAPLIQASGMAIRAVVTRRADEVSACLPGARVCSSMDELLADHDIQLVVIATANSMHFEQAAAALRVDRHVVVDKPMCVSSAEARALVRLANDRQRVLSVFHNRRWDADFRTIERLLREGRLGEVRLFQARWDRFRPQAADRWRERDEAGGGVLFDLGSHLIDQMLALFGMPEWVQADVFRQRATASSDDGFELLFGLGAQRLSLAVNSLVAASACRYAVHGTAGTFIKHGIDPQESQLRAGMHPRDAQFGVEADGDYGVFTDGRTQASERVPSVRGEWLHYYRQMEAAIEGRAEAPVPPDAAVCVLEVIEAARLSSRTGERIALQ